MGHLLSLGFQFCNLLTNYDTIKYTSYLLGWMGGDQDVMTSCLKPPHKLIYILYILVKITKDNSFCITSGIL